LNKSEALSGKLRHSFEIYFHQLSHVNLTYDALIDATIIKR